MIDLYNDDCTRIIKEIKEAVKNPIIVTDPPFNVDYHYNTYSDNKNDDEYYKWLAYIFDDVPFVCIHYPESLYKISHITNIIPERVVSWIYNSNTPRQHRDIAFFNVKPDFNKVKQPYKNPNDKRIQKRIAKGKIGCKLYDWWNINQIKNVSKNKNGINHPCSMPLAVMNNIIGILPDDVTIIDPFLGSGTTGLSCKKLNKNFIGIEMDKDYFELAKKRIENGIIEKDTTDDINNSPLFNI